MLAGYNDDNLQTLTCYPLLFVEAKTTERKLPCQIQINQGIGRLESPGLPSVSL